MRAQELAAFRWALRRQKGLVPVNDRRKEPRYLPIGPMARARVKLTESAEPIDADVIDVSFSGLRLAVHSNLKPEQGTTCKVQLTTDGSQTLLLEGEIRWTEHHPLISVFGVLLEPGTITQLSP